MSSLNLPIIRPLCDIANLIECVAMFYFIKGLSVFCIVTEPCADRFLLFGGFPISLHHVLDVGGFGGRKEGLVPFRGEMYNRVNGSPEHLACLVENIKNSFIATLSFRLVCSAR